MNSRTLFGPLGVSIIALIALSLVVFAQVPGVIGAALTPGVEQVALDKEINSLVKEHKAKRKVYEGRFEGRSAFYAPEPPRDDPRETHDEPPLPQRDAGAASSYSGPLRPQGLHGDKVVFASGNNAVILKVGETKQGVRLVSIDGPFSVSVAWTAPPTARDLYSEGTYSLRIWEWPGGLISSIPPQPGMGAEIIVPPPDLQQGDPRDNGNDPRDMMRRRAEEVERRNRERDENAEEDEEVVEEEVAEEEVIEDEGAGDEDVPDETGDDGDGDGNNGGPSNHEENAR